MLTNARIRCIDCIIDCLLRIVGARRAFSRLVGEAVELAPAQPSAQPPRSATVGALERQLEEHGLTLGDVMGLFDELADDSESESEQPSAPKPPSAAPLCVVGNVVRKSDASPLGHVRTRDGSRRLIYDARLDESSFTYYNRVFGGIRIILLKRRPKIGNPVVGALQTTAFQKAFVPLRPLAPVSKIDGGEVNPCSDDLLYACEFLLKHR